MHNVYTAYAMLYFNPLSVVTFLGILYSLHFVVCEAGDFQEGLLR